MTRRALRLALQNPSPYPRAGLIVVPWRGVDRHLNPLSPPLVAFDLEGRPMPAQIDRIDPADPGSDQLVVLHTLPLPPGDEDYRTDCGMIEVREAGERFDPLTAAETYPTGVRLRSDTLELWLQLQPESYPGSRWFAGAVTSVQRREGIELLDPLASEVGLQHDPEKRAMQIDRVCWYVSAAGGHWSREDAFFDQPWSIVSTTSGPIRATATIAAPPLHCELPSRGRFRPCVCVVYRTLGVYAGFEHISDEVWTVVRSMDGGDIPDVEIGVHYFMAVNFSLLSRIFQNPVGPGWFTVTGDVRPRAGYAFASESHATQVLNPPPDFPERMREHTAFAWGLMPSRAVRSFHLFRNGEGPREFADRAGKLWYDFAYKPLRARAIE